MSVGNTNISPTMAIQPQGILPTLYPNCIEPPVEAVQRDVPTGKGRRELADGESDFGALVYIVVVLVFYSAG